MILEQLLIQARQQLSDYSPTAVLDVRLLACYFFQTDPTGLFRDAHQIITAQQQQQFEQLIKRRQQGEPVAYITGSKAFYGHEFLVTAATLIPRPETELLVEQALQLGADNLSVSVVDLGTGSGAIAISIALERPNWSVLGVDKSAQALEVAKQNATRLAPQHQQLSWQQGSWLDGVTQQFDIIVSNPPYIAADDPALADDVRRYEPPLALFAEQEGLSAIVTIVEQAKARLKPKGWLLLEHGYQQGKAVQQLLAQAGFADIATLSDLAGLERVTLGSNVGDCL